MCVGGVLFRFYVDESKRTRERLAKFPTDSRIWMMRLALFDILPSELFKPLASPSRTFYADLLLSLHEKTFGLVAEAPRRSDVLYEIAAFQRSWERNYGTIKDDDASTPATSEEDRARTVYKRLVDTGWLIESKDRYIRLVDLDPDASGLLHVLSAITRGETRTYGGAVIGVLSALESAAANPEERSENIRNALKGARDFLAHMRIVSVSLRKLEEYILRRESLHDIFKAFFEDFVQRHLITDFKTLHTKTNPFRFRSRIIHQAAQMSASPLLIQTLAEAYSNESRSSTAEAGRNAVQHDLSEIITIFEGTENHLAAIDATVARIEKRILNTARYMDRAGRNTEVRIIEAIKAISKVGSSADEIAVKTGVIPSGLPLGPPHIPAPRRQRPPIEVVAVRETRIDPAFEAFSKAKADYVRITRVTPRSMFDFIDRLFQDRQEIRGDEIPVHTVEEFICFQRLREIPSIFDGAAASRYEIQMLDERLKSPWIECQNFIIRPRAKAKKESVRNAA